MKMWGFSCHWELLSSLMLQSQVEIIGKYLLVCLFVSKHARQLETQAMYFFFSFFLPFKSLTIQITWLPKQKFISHLPFFFSDNKQKILHKRLIALRWFYRWLIAVFWATRLGSPGRWMWWSSQTCRELGEGSDPAAGLKQARLLLWPRAHSLLSAGCCA